MMPIILTGEPRSTQNIYRSTCRGGFSTTYMSAEGKALKEQYFYEVKSQWKRKPLKGPVALTICFFFGTKRVRDLDNFSKLVIDSLNGIVVVDDSQIYELHIYREYDKQKPRIELSVVEQ